MATSVQAGPTNPGFESGLFGWTSNNPGQVSAVTSATASTAGSFLTGATAFTTVLPTEGSMFAAISAGSPTTTLTSSSFMVDIGDLVTFDLAFSAEDYSPYTDFGAFIVNLFVDGSVIGGGTFATVGSVGNYGFFDWTEFSVLSPVAGLITMVFSSTNFGDDLLDSTVFVDNIELIKAVPEPGSVLLLVVGLFAFSFFRKKNLFKQADNTAVA